MLITFEGGECAGKDLQIGLLSERLQKDGFSVNSDLYEPGSTLKAEILRVLVKNKFDSSYSFPGSFKQSLDFNKYKSDFAKEIIPPIAEKYLREALQTTKIEQPAKHDTIYFLLHNRFPEGGMLERAIESMKNTEFLGVGQDNSKTASISDYVLMNHYSKEKLTPESQMYLYMAARNILHHGIMKQKLSAYHVIILNRSRHSSEVYQGHAQDPSLIPEIRKRNNEATEGIIPAATIFIDIPVEEMIERKKKRSQTERYAGGPKDFFDEKKMQFHESVRQGYLSVEDYYNSLPKEHPEHGVIKRVDGIGTPGEIHERIWRVVYSVLKRG